MVRWVIAALFILFLFTGLRNVRVGDAEEGVRRIPIPRRMMGLFQLFVALLLGGLVISMFTTIKT
jgi:hypothetical protein